MADRLAYKILKSNEFAALQAGTFAGAPVDIADGYIHLSTAAQLTETVRRHFAGESALVVAAINLAALGDALRWEPSRGGGLFPHFYGRLTMAHVTASVPLTWDGDAVRLP
jgi:uncharacterized protein (DUF952 family)